MTTTDITASTESTDTGDIRSTRDPGISTELTDQAGISVTSVSFACSRTNDTIVISRISAIHINHRLLVFYASKPAPPTTIPSRTLGCEIYHRTRSGLTTVPIHSNHRSPEHQKQPKKPSLNYAPNIIMPSSERTSTNRLRFRTFSPLQPSIPQTLR